MTINPVNQNTARRPGNLTREGRVVLISPLEAFGDVPAGAFVDLGLFPPEEKIAVTADVTREEIRAQDPYGGPPILLTEDVSEVSAVYDNIPVLTPDDTVRALHVGSTPTNMSGALAGATVSPFAPGMSVAARMIVIRRSQTSDTVKVYWHPRVALQSNGEGDNQNRETLQFRAPVQSYLGPHVAALQPYDAAITAMGAVFTVPEADLDALLDILRTEALAEAPAPDPAP